MLMFWFDIKISDKVFYSLRAIDYVSGLGYKQSGLHLIPPISSFWHNCLKMCSTLLSSNCNSIIVRILLWKARLLDARVVLSVNKNSNISWLVTKANGTHMISIDDQCNDGALEHLIAQYHYPNLIEHIFMTSQSQLTSCE